MHHFRLFSCSEIGCGKRWWTADDEANPGHECTATDKVRRLTPTVVTFLADTREIGVPETQPKEALRPGKRQHGTQGI